MTMIMPSSDPLLKHSPAIADPYVLDAQGLFRLSPEEREATIRARLDVLPEDVRAAVAPIGDAAVRLVTSQNTISSAPKVLQGLDLLAQLYRPTDKQE